MDKVLEFPREKQRRLISANDVETIGFLTADDRNLHISDPEDIVRIMAFIVQNKIKIFED